MDEVYHAEVLMQTNVSDLLAEQRNDCGSNSARDELEITNFVYHHHHHDHLFARKHLVDNNKRNATRMWANAQPDGRPAKHRCSTPQSLADAHY